MRAISYELLILSGIMSDAKADTVPGLGFKDKDKALETLKILEGRDPDYQRLAVKGLIGRAKRTLTCMFPNIPFVLLNIVWAF